MPVLAMQSSTFTLSLKCSFHKQSISFPHRPGLGISKSKENVFHERDKLKSEVGKNEKKIEALQVQIAALEKQLQEKDNKINKFYEMMDESSTETTKDKRLIASLQVSVEEANREREKFMTDYDLLKSEVGENMVDSLNFLN